MGFEYEMKPKRCISCPETDLQAKGIYEEIVVKLSDGSKMKVGICQTCLAKSSELDASKIVEAHVNYQIKALKHITQKQEERLKSLSGSFI